MRKISILDTTLRDGEQAPQNAMNPKQKLKIALELEALGVNHIETGFPASSTFDFEATKLISQEVTLSGIATFSRTLEKDVQLAFNAAGRSKNHTIQIVATGSDIHLRNKRNITRSQSIDEMMNTNGLIRQYLPKRAAIDKLTSVQTEKIATELNRRPRKSLGWFTPDEVMAGFYTVALRS